MSMKACACIFKSVSVVMNVTVTSPHTACVRQRNALADAACLTHWAEMQLSELCSLHRTTESAENKL